METKKIHVSIIIPTYNMANLLEKSLLFLEAQHQTQDSDIQIIIVDDGSSDHTRVVAEQFMKRLDNVLYLHRPRDEDSCRSRTRNLGAAKASGDVLFFLDSGVLVPPDFVLSLVEQHSAYKDALLLYNIVGQNLDP